MAGAKKARQSFDAIEVSVVFPVAAKVLCDGWLDSKIHSDFTGGEAVIDSKVGGKHSAWDGYISGVTRAVEPGKCIVQSWRTTEFSAKDKDSTIEVLFAKAPGGTKVTLKHTDIPRAQGATYKQGWEDYYFKPMRAYFSGKTKKKKK